MWIVIRILAQLVCLCHYALWTKECVTRAYRCRGFDQHFSGFPSPGTSSPQASSACLWHVHLLQLVSFLYKVLMHLTTCWFCLFYKRVTVHTSLGLSCLLEVDNSPGGCRCATTLIDLDELPKPSCNSDLDPSVAGSSDLDAPRSHSPHARLEPFSLSCVLCHILLLHHSAILSPTSRKNRGMALHLISRVHDPISPINPPFSVCRLEPSRLEVWLKPVA